MIRLALVEDHPIVVDGVRAALAAAGGIEVVGEAATLGAARPMLAAAQCDVVLLDLRLPDGSGFELLRDAAEGPGAPAFLVLSSFMTAEYVSAAVALGAAGFLLKTSPAAEIAAVVGLVAGGGLAFTPEQLRASRSAAWRPLSARDHELLEGVVRGRSNDELASDLGISTKTVEAYMTRLLARFGAASRTELAVALERGLTLDLPHRPAQPSRPPDFRG